jgi:subtilisin family serine protease
VPAPNHGSRRSRKERVGRDVSRSRRRLRLETLETRRCLAAAAWLPNDFSLLEVDPTSYDPSSLIVKYESSAQSAGLADGIYGPTRVARESDLGFDLHHVELHPGVSLESMLQIYQLRDGVEYVEPNYRVRLAGIPNDPQFANQWDLHNIGQQAGTVDADIDAPEAWDVTTGTGSTIVAVIDTGVDYLHPDLAPNMWTNPGEIPGDGVDNDNNGYVDDVHGYDFVNDDGSPMDDNNHGTHVAGTIGAEGMTASG